MSHGNKLQDLYDSLFGPDDDTAECAYNCAGQRPGNSAQVTGLPRHVMPANESVTKQIGKKEYLQCVGPDGMSLVKAWLSCSQQENVLQAIKAEGWLTGTANQAMCFGKLPRWTRLLADMLPLEHWPEQIRSRCPVFDQMIVNSYKPGEGIKNHIDLMKFDDGIAIMSLGSPAMMTFTRAEALGTATDHSDIVRKGACSKICNGCSDNKLVSACSKDDSRNINSLQQNIILEPGDLLLLHGEARYGWEHGIAAQQHCSLASAVHRVSVTLRKLAV
ncbi:TPA: hypothetical protein ACH3X1_003813 [Trebouxia sp. C0004]